MIEILTLLVHAIALAVQAMALIQKTIEERRRKKRARALMAAAVACAGVVVLLWVGRKS